MVRMRGRNSADVIPVPTMPFLIHRASVYRIAIDRMVYLSRDDDYKLLKSRSRLGENSGRFIN